MGMGCWNAADACPAQGDLGNGIDARGCPNPTSATSSAPNCDLPPTGRIAFSSDMDGNKEIYVMNADGSNIQRLTVNVDSDSDPTWSPDGTQIAFVSDRDGNSEIYVMEVIPNVVPRRLTIEPGGGCGTGLVAGWDAHCFYILSEWRK